VRAWREAISGRPGPVHLSIPNDVLDAVVEVPLPSAGDFVVEERPPEEEAVLDALVTARQPVVIAGPAMMRKAMQGFEDAIGGPVIGMESPRGVNDPSLGCLA